MSKKIIRLTESDLHRIVKESVKGILREFDYNDPLPEKWNETGGDYRWDTRKYNGNKIVRGQNSKDFDWDAFENLSPENREQAKKLQRDFDWDTEDEKNFRFNHSTNPSREEIVDKFELTADTPEEAEEWHHIKNPKKGGFFKKADKLNRFTNDTRDAAGMFKDGYILADV